MLFPEKYFYDEVREGFYVNGAMKHVWAAQLEVLAEIDKVCKKYNIQWFADCGTLLGAVRHGGYIPWDDDLDICMLRDDYLRFHRYAVKDLPEQFEVRTYENEKNWHHLTHVLNREKIILSGAELEKYHGCPYIVGVDVFVYDYLSTDPEEEEARRKLYDAVHSIGSEEGMNGDDLTEEAEESLKIAEELCNIKIRRDSHVRRQIFSLADALASMFPSAGAKEVALMTFWAKDHSQKFPIEYVNKITQLPFESMMINVPAAYDAVLRIKYGDYLRMERKGGMHDYPCYQSQEDYLAVQLGVPDLYQYKANADDLKKVKEKAPQKLKSRVLDYCTLAKQIFDMVDKMILNEQYQQIMSLLEQCQDAVINLGNEIEEKAGEEATAVSIVEEYCEAIYQLSIAIEEQEPPAMRNCIQLIIEKLSELEDDVRSQLDEKKEILFLPFCDRFWGEFDALYRQAVQDPANHVVVMPIPYYEKDYKGEYKKMCFETDVYPEDIILTDYRSYDIRQQHPDVIYIQNGYDRYNYSCSIPQEFYSSELKKYTEELVYIPFFRMGEHDLSDEKSLYSTRYYIKIPGVANADRVIVESAKMRDYYIDILSDFFGEDSRKLWEEKIEERRG